MFFLHPRDFLNSMPWNRPPPEQPLPVVSSFRTESAVAVERLAKSNKRAAALRAHSERLLRFEELLVGAKSYLLFTSSVYAIFFWGKRLDVPDTHHFDKKGPAVGKPTKNIISQNDNQKRRAQLYNGN